MRHLKSKSAIHVVAWCNCWLQQMIQNLELGIDTWNLNAAAIECAVELQSLWIQSERKGKPTTGNHQRIEWRGTRTD
jgi:hypothetical protein